MAEKGILDEDIEAILDNADKEFQEKQEDVEGIKEFDDAFSKREEIKWYQDILIALGFIRYDNGDKGIAYKLHAGHLQIGRTFTDKIPIGNMWVRCLVDGEHGKKDEFLKREQLKEIPQVALFYHIRDGELSMPTSDVMGSVTGKSEKAIQVVFDEFEESRTEWWGIGALKRSQEGIMYVPSSYSKQTEKYNAKMQVPRDILLLDYEAELKKAPTTVSTSDVGHIEEHTEKVERSTMADLIPHKEPVALSENEKPTVDYYVSLIGEITEKVDADERIARTERGYAINMVFSAITKDTRAALIAELKKEGNHEE